MHYFLFSFLVIIIGFLGSDGLLATGFLLFPACWRLLLLLFEGLLFEGLLLGLELFLLLALLLFGLLLFAFTAAAFSPPGLRFLFDFFLWKIIEILMVYA